MNTAPEIIQPQETDSTNTYLKKVLEQRKLPECSVVITNNQTAGRGQPGNAWESEPGKNITFSMVLYPGMIAASEQFIISKAITVAITEALEKYINPIHIKWPNDLYYNNSKIGGILIENSLNGSVIDQCIAGIGININQVYFSKNLPNPTSIKKITDKDTDLISVFESLYQSIIDHYTLLTENNPQTIEDKYLAHFYRKSGLHQYCDVNGEFYATFSGIGPAGHLLLKRENDVISKYAFKEVEFII